MKHIGNHKFNVHLRRVATGETKVEPFECGYTEGDGEHHVEACIFLWTEGNYSCDCNRSLFLYKDESKHLPCGDDEILVDKIVEVATGEIVYSETDHLSKV